MTTTLLLLLVNGSLIAGIYALAKIAAADGVSAGAMLAWQLLFSAPVVWAVAAARGQAPRRRDVDRAALRYAAIAGVLGISAPNLLTFAALSHDVPAGLIGVIGALSPVFTYLIVLALRIERPQALRAVGVALGLAGVLWVLLPGRGAASASGEATAALSAASEAAAALSASSAHATTLPWAIAAIGAPLLLAAGNVFRTRAWPAGLAPLTAASLTLALQAALVVPGTLLLGGELRLPTPALRAADLALLGAGVLTSAFYLGAFELQRRAGPVAVGQLGYVITVASLVIGALAFGERPGAATLLAVLVVLGGVMLVQRAAPVRASAAGAATRSPKRCPA